LSRAQAPGIGRAIVEEFANKAASVLTCGRDRRSDDLSSTIDWLAAAADHGHDGVRCNAICPGWITTDMADAAFGLAKNPDLAILEPRANFFFFPQSASIPPHLRSQPVFAQVMGMEGKLGVS